MGVLIPLKIVQQEPSEEGEQVEEVEQVEEGDKDPLPPNVSPIHGPVPPEDIPELGLPSRLIV